MQNSDCVVVSPRILWGFFLVLAWCLSRSARSELAGWVTPPRLIRVFWRSIEPNTLMAIFRVSLAHQKPTEAS